MKQRLAAFLRRWANGLDPQPGETAAVKDSAESMLVDIEDRIWALWMVATALLDPEPKSKPPDKAKARKKKD
jgi:hypothetical protein